MANAPELGGSTLPYPSKYEIDYVLRGATNEMADGSVTIDIVNDSGVGNGWRRIWTMGWENTSAGNASSILASYTALITAGSLTFRPIDTAASPTITVTPVKSTKMTHKLKTIIGTTHYFDLEFEVKEHF